MVGKMPDISIIVPIYNTAKYLRRCIESILRQSYRNIEIILVNDGSTDNSPEIIQEYAALDGRIKIISQENRGLSAARNAGIEAARGEYILHTDSDDWIEPDMAELLYNAAKENNADMAAGDVFIEYSNRTVIKKEPYGSICMKDDILTTFTFHKGLNSLCNKLIKTNLLHSSGVRQYEDIFQGEDSNALLRLFLFANKIVCVHKPLYHYDIRATTMSRGTIRDVYQFYEGLSRVEQFYKEHNADISLFPFIRLKICYNELNNVSLIKALIKRLPSYIKTYRAFYKDIHKILFNKLFFSLPLNYQLYVIYKFVCKLF